jgi:hypothetical protein
MDLLAWSLAISIPILIKDKALDLIFENTDYVTTFKQLANLIGTDKGSKLLTISWFYATAYAAIPLVILYVLVSACGFRLTFRRAKPIWRL